MDFPRLEVIKLNGEKLFLDKNPRELVQALEEDGCLVLKGATDLTSVEATLSDDLSSVDSVRKDIVLNTVRVWP